MKEFKNYIKKEYPHINSGDEMFAWDIWRAALKWVKKEAISLDERGDSNRNVINRELGDK